MAKAETPAAPNADKALLERARKQFRTIVDAESALRKEMLIDREFRAGKQWDGRDRKNREDDGRPVLTQNLIPQLIRLVTNQQRQSRPAIQVNPVDSGADPDTAEVFQGVIRHIETASDAEVAYDTACEQQVEMGRGYWRVLTEFCDDDSDDQDIRIERIANQFSVYIDPAARKADRSDMRYAFITEDVPKEEYEARYGSASLLGLEEFVATGDESAQDWMPEGKVRIAEYFYVEHQDADGGKVRKRKVRKPVVKWCKIVAHQVLERTDWAGKYIPVVPVLGDEIDINGVVDLRGIVRDARDPQREINFWSTLTAETILSSNKSPYIVAEGQIEGHEAKWNQANRRAFPYIEYKPLTIAGTLAPPPQRNQAEPPIQALVVAQQQAKQALQDVTGLHDPSHGKGTREESGKAVLARQQQGDLANSHYLDNLGRSIRHTGRILIDLIPKIYDAPRVLKILGADEKPREVMVGAGQQNIAAAQQQPLPEGVERIYDLSVGRYDVTISVGPSNQTRRQAAVESMIQFVQAYPNAFPLIGDLLAENMDWPGAKQIAERLRAMLPEPLQQKDGPGAAMAAQQRLMQAEQALQMLQAQLQEAQQIINGKQVEAQAKERIAIIEAETKKAIAELEGRFSVLRESAKIEAENQRTAAKIVSEQEMERVRLLADAVEADTSRVHTTELSEREASRPSA